ncbi:hypothetical protein QSE00_23705 [Arenibacter sp. M-2]|uniref:Ig-like domain-containing protein n=1 Tax=Arenibacter sp. M-2 TaxID=3053612 RepID=UPI0025703948|nr:Ig-like domain-containing protein [Arenibacter sp. M-2]MDL5514836.1 hypothetical protein [Arenibacter sp. M-2]
MFRIKILFITILFLLIACTEEDSSSEKEKEIIQNILIELNIENDVVSTSEEITITLTGDALISKLEVLMDNGIIHDFNSPPYTLTLETQQYEDGEHTFRVDAYADGKIIGTKTIKIKIDNQGPILILDSISENEIICDEIQLSPSITDLVSSVEQLQVYLDDLLLLEKENTTDYTFSLNPQELPTGIGNLIFVMEDALGNVSKDSMAIGIANKFFRINFPNDFMRKNVEKVHVVISDIDGNYIDSKTHESGEIETLSFCTTEELYDNTEFTITFIHDFENSIFNFYVYNNLTLNMLGNEITLNQQSGGLSPSFPKIKIPFFEAGYQMRASSPWNSLIYYNDELSGHVSTAFSNDLATNMTFISYFNSDIENSYQWAFISDIQNRTSLVQEDFSNANVLTKTFDLNKRFQRPLVKITGYENEDMYRARSGHLLYADYIQSSTSYTKQYIFPDIFEHTTYWGQLLNYTFEGSGTIPATVTVPNSTVDYNFNNQQLSFSGLPDFEVGRLRLVGISSGAGLITPENPSVQLEFIFDGQNTNPTIPVIPEGLFPEAVTKIFASKAFEVKQGAAENYSTFNSYQDYIENVLVPSVPFYIPSPFRERIFKSESAQWSPSYEFPF